MKLCRGSLTLWERTNGVPFSLFRRHIISFSWSPQPGPSKARQPTVIRHVINHTHVSYAPWNLRFNTSHGKWRRHASWLQYKYILCYNMSFFCLWISIGRIRRGVFLKCCANYSLPNRPLEVREEPWRSDFWERGQKSFKRIKKNPIWFVICEWQKWRRIFRESWPEEKGHEYW